MPQRIVDDLEPIEFDGHERRIRAVRTECIGQPVMQGRAVGQFGDGICRGQLVELLADNTQLFGMLRALPQDQCRQ